LVRFGPAILRHIVTGMSTLRTTFGLRLLFDPTFVRVAVGVVLAITLALRALQLIALSGDEFWGYDLSAYLAAGQRVLNGESPYQAFQLEGSYSPHLPELYLYPPLLAVLAAPFAAITDNYRVANWIWGTLGVVILAASTIALSRRERIATGRDLLLLLMAVLAFAPVTGEFFIGNVNLALAGLLAGAWLALRTGSARGEVAAGALVAVAALIKVFPILVILWFVLDGRRRAAIAALATMGLLVLATIPVVGLQPWLDYPTVLLNLGPPEQMTHVLAPSAWLSELVPVPVARAIVFVAAIAAMVWATLRRSDPVSYALAVTASLLVAPALFHHYLVLLLVPLLLAVRHTTSIVWIVLAYLLMSVGNQAVLGEGTWIGSRLLPTAGAVLVAVGLLVWGERRNMIPAVPAMA
jgi:alpha-1,2-mannosyltransferase